MDESGRIIARYSVFVVEQKRAYTGHFKYNNTENRKHELNARDAPDFDKQLLPYFSLR